MSNLAGIALAVLAALGLSIAVICIRIGTDDGRSVDALVVVLLTNIAILVPVTLALQNPLSGLTRTSLVSFAMAGLVGTFVGRAFFYASIERVGASRSEPIRASQPIYATLAAVIVLGEVLTPEHFAGILLIVLGVGAISWETASGSVQQTGRSYDLAFPFVAAFFYGIEPIFAKIGFATGTSVLVGLSIKTVVATAGFLAYLRWRNALPTSTELASSSLRWYVGAGIANTVFLLGYYAALEIAPVVLVVPIIQISPLLVAVLSFVFLKRLETVTVPLILSAVVVVVGGILVSIHG
ncbi:DMT family transporter [Natrarchaeobius halalkaliphilus]|uniref:DMT family transporter n=1 Tax=Natrarchaeobius halalkaliphilus TaxID=1679091 RepID=A0A3N6LLD7_9EURY|nr:EamA family transporter [Natrarchaeobius halalkaliphilus]RQG87910.1 DMT family transporter [Natrarchaeobius halalkaliphilus]